jgi:rhodanese-related sulfurtransferase
LQLPPDQEVIFMCASGQRSAMASEIAALTGLQKIYNLENGINGWIYRGYPVEH